MTPILQVDAVRKRYGAAEILRGVSFTVDAGETLAVIGPNGAGKTTLFKVMTGEEKLDGGCIRFNGVDLVGTSAHHRVRSGIGRTFQVARVFGAMTALENVVVAVESRRRSAGEPSGVWWRSQSKIVLDEADALLADLGLDRSRHDEAATLSHGDKKRLELAVALGLRPSLLMLDEPTAGMSPDDRRAAAALIARIRDEHGMTVVLTEHDMDVVFGLADRLLVLNYGEVVALGSPRAIRDDPTVRSVYLGHELQHE